MSLHIFPRWFSDTTVPVLDGQPLLVARGEPAYTYYLSRLADYLPTLVPEGSGIVDFDFKNRRGESGIIGDNAFHHLEYCYWPFEPYLKNGDTYETAYEDLKELHQEIFKDNEFELEEVTPITDCVSPLIWNNAVREFEALKEVDASHLDIGYRHLLAPLVAGVENHRDRTLILRSFYFSFHDEASK